MRRFRKCLSIFCKKVRQTMNNIKMLRLHIKSQLFLYLLPTLFLYAIFLPYQYQILHIETVNQGTITKLCNSSQIYLTLGAIWHQYLGFRILFHQELKESVSNLYKKHLFWFFLCVGMYLLILTPYFLWLHTQLPNYSFNTIVFIFQIITVSSITCHMTKLFRSSLIGFYSTISWIFLSFLHIIPDQFCIIRIGFLPIYFEIEWYIVQISIILFIFIIHSISTKFEHIK